MILWTVDNHGQVNYTEVGSVQIKGGGVFIEGRCLKMEDYEVCRLLSDEGVVLQAIKGMPNYRYSDPSL